LSGVPSWLTASASSGTLTIAATTITFTVNASANGLSPASYGAIIAFTNATNGQGNTSRMATLTVSPAAGPGGGGAGAPASQPSVSAAGNDGNACTLAAPCLTFQRALTQTTAGGEIGVLGPGSYGPLDITTSVNVTNDGSGEASILVPSGGGIGIMVDAGRGDIVRLRGLIIEGQAAGSVGIEFVTGSALHVQNCVIRNLEDIGAGIGIMMLPGGASQLFVSHTIIFNNGSFPNTGGILIQPHGTGSADVVLDRLRLENNVFGLKADGSRSTGPGAHVVLRGSVVSGNAG